MPVGADRYELYCEEPDDTTVPDAVPPSGVIPRVTHRFREMLAEAERERRGGQPDTQEAPRSFAARAKARTMRWVAESIAEQRLLWQLRTREAATLVHPDDLSDAHAREILRRGLNRDFERHRFWLAIDSLGLIASAALMLLPGPNVVAYYFAFRIVGHFLSARGARHGMAKTVWAVEPCAPLSALRSIVDVPPEDRADRLRAIAGDLRLEHLAAFFQRTAIR